MNLITVARPVLNSRLGSRMGQTAQQGYNLINLITAVLGNYCQQQGASPAKCTEFQGRLTLCWNQLNGAVAVGDIVTIGVAVYCLSQLKADVDSAMDAIGAPPPTGGGTVTPQPSSFPWTTVAIVGGGLSVVAIGLWLVLRKKK